MIAHIGEVQRGLGGLQLLLTPEKRATALEYRMGPDHFVWTLTPAGAGCRLVLEHITDERDMMPMVAAGWHLCLAVADANLAGEPQEPIRGADARNYGWEDLAKEYGENLDIPYTGWPFDEPT